MKILNKIVILGLVAVLAAPAFAGDLSTTQVGDNDQKALESVKGPHKKYCKHKRHLKKAEKKPSVEHKDLDNAKSTSETPGLDH